MEQQKNNSSVSNNAASYSAAINLAQHAAMQVVDRSGSGGSHPSAFGAVGGGGENLNQVGAQEPAAYPPAIAADVCLPTNGTASVTPPASDAAEPPKKKRLCRYPGCIRVIKSQGHCQRHGAKAKRCKVDGCDKQAQGTHDGMCKRHWKAVNFPDAPPVAEAQPITPEGESVYDSILPLSISYRPSSPVKAGKDEEDLLVPEKTDPMDPPAAPEGASVMPLVSFLKEGQSKEPGWHRNAERRSRGISPMTSLTCQFEPWERQLVVVEILLLSGGTPYANFKDLAHAWGREKGFHRCIPWGQKRFMGKK